MRLDIHIAAHIHPAHDAGLEPDIGARADAHGRDHEKALLPIVRADGGAAADRYMILDRDQAGIGDIRGIDHNALADFHAHHPVEKQVEWARRNEIQKRIAHHISECVVQHPGNRAEGIPRTAECMDAKRQQKIHERHDEYQGYAVRKKSGRQGESQRAVAQKNWPGLREFMSGIPQKNPWRSREPDAGKTQNDQGTKHKQGADGAKSPHKAFQYPAEAGFIGGRCQNIFPRLQGAAARTLL